MFSIFRKQLLQTLAKCPTRRRFITISNTLQPSRLTAITLHHNLQITRFKSKGAKNKIPPPQISGSESEESEDQAEDEISDKNTRVMTSSVKSMRIDAIIKAGLGLARNKIETLFYESKIRVNGEKVPKKSVFVNEGDEIDIIKGPSVDNPDFLVVARIEVLNVSQKGESLNVKLRRCKSLTIENYNDNK